MDILRNLFGNLTSGIIRLAVTVGILAAVYFFIVRPVLDTTENVSNEINTHDPEVVRSRQIGASNRAFDRHPRRTSTGQVEGARVSRR